MLLIIASRHDRSAAALAERWKQLDARLLTCADLSTAGWRYYPGETRNSRAVLGGEIVPFERIAGVVTCVPMITEAEVVHIEPGDRRYVAAEMNAFLAAWLSEGVFPVANRPTPGCLMGPNWSQTRWVHEAARAGLRIKDRDDSPRIRLCGQDSGDGPPTRVTVVGDRCFGDASIRLAAQARNLARAAQVHSMTVAFSSPDGNAKFARAYLGVALDQIQVADAMLDSLLASAAAVA